MTRINWNVFANFRVSVTLGGCFEYSFVFILVKCHPRAPLTININMVFLEFYFWLFEYNLFTYWAHFHYFPLSRTFVRLFCRSSLLCSLIFYRGYFSRLGIVVLVPLIGGFHVKDWCSLLSYILRFSWFFQVGNVEFYTHIICVIFSLHNLVFPIRINLL